jgi:hypothetical protein
MLKSEVSHWCYCAALVHTHTHTHTHNTHTHTHLQGTPLIFTREALSDRGHVLSTRKGVRVQGQNRGSNFLPRHLRLFVIWVCNSNVCATMYEISCVAECLLPGGREGGRNKGGRKGRKAATGDCCCYHQSLLSPHFPPQPSSIAHTNTHTLRRAIRMPIAVQRLRSSTLTCSMAVTLACMQQQHIRYLWGTCVCRVLPHLRKQSMSCSYRTLLKSN